MAQPFKRERKSRLTNAGTVQCRDCGRLFHSSPQDDPTTSGFVGSVVGTVGGHGSTVAGQTADAAGKIAQQTADEAFKASTMYHSAGPMFADDAYGAYAAAWNASDDVAKASSASKVATKVGYGIAAAQALGRVTNGLHKWSGRESMRGVGSAGGGVVGGALSGAGSGAAAGLVCGPIGSAVCGVAGGVVGAIGGSWAGANVSDRAADVMNMAHVCPDCMWKSGKKKSSSSSSSSGQRK